MRSKHSPAPELAVHVTRDALAHDVSEPGPTGCWRDAVCSPRGLEVAGNTTGPALSLVPKDCFRRKSLWGKQHGKEERTTEEGQGSLSCCTWYPTFYFSWGRGAGRFAYCPWGQQTLASVTQTPMPPQPTSLGVSGAPSTPQNSHKARDVGKDQPPFLEVSNIGRGLGALTSDLHCGLCCGMAGF